MSLSDAISRFAGTTQDLSDKAARKAQRGLNDAKDVADDAADAMSDKLGSARDKVGPTLDRASRRAQDMATQGLQVAGRAAQQLRDGVMDLADGATSYTKNNPMKAVMIAAASGAVIFGLFKAFSSTRE